MPEIKITCICNNEELGGTRDKCADFHLWHQDAGLAVCVSDIKSTDDEKKDLYAGIDKQDAIMLSQQILQMYQISFTPNALCK